MKQYSLRFMMVAVAGCAVQAFAYAQLGLVDWLFGNASLGWVLLSIYLVKQKRWRQLVQSLGVFLMALGLAIPALPSNASTASKQYVCTKCLATRFVFTQTRAARGAFQSEYSTSSTETADVTNPNCLHAWTIRSTSAQNFRYLFGLKLPLSRESSRASPNVLPVSAKPAGESSSAS